MGREASCLGHVGATSAPVKALLESDALILRGAIKRRFEIGSLNELRVAGGQLLFSAGGETVALELGDPEAGRWLAKITTPPPSLAAKLGIGAEHKAFVLGRLDDAALLQALQGAQTTSADKAALLLAIVHDEAGLAAMVEKHRTMACRAVWVVHGKGRAAPLGDTRIRQVLRALGYVDNKSTAVSAHLTATRYLKP